MLNPHLHVTSKPPRLKSLRFALGIPLALAALVACSSSGTKSAAPDITTPNTAASNTAAPNTTAPTAANSDANSPGASATGPLTKVSVALDFTPIQGFMVPVVVAKELGYYKDAGLDLSIDVGSSSTTGIQQVDAGKTTFGYVDVGKAALAVNKGAKVTAVAVYMQKNQGTVIARASEGITSPDKLAGKSVGTTTGSSSETDFLAMLAVNGISKDSMTIQSVSSASKIATLLSGKVDAITGFLGSECVQVKLAIKDDVNCLPVADYGVSSLGEGIVVSNQTLADSPDVVKAFLDATDRAWQYSLDHPQEAVDTAQKSYPLAKADLLLAQFNESKSLLHTDATKDCTVGYMSPQDWDSTVDFLKKYAKLDSSAVATTFYHNILSC